MWADPRSRAGITSASRRSSVCIARLLGSPSASHTLSGLTKVALMVGMPSTSTRETAPMLSSMKLKAGTSPTPSTFHSPSAALRSNFTGIRNDSSYFAQSPMLFVFEVTSA